MLKDYLLKELSRYEIGTWADVIYRNALVYSDRVALVYGDTRLTFSQFNERVNRLVDSLHKMGAKKGDVLGILSWNCLSFLEIYGAAMKGGFIASPFNPRLKADELDYIINYSRAETLFVGEELQAMAASIRTRLSGVKNYIALESAAEGMSYYEDLLASGSSAEPEINITANDPVCIIYTSGTTGVPRGALYTQGRFIDDSRTLALDMELSADSRRVQVTPLFHIAGNSHFRSSMYTGGRNIIVKFFDAAETMGIIQDERATHIDCVPTHLAAMLNLPDLKKYDFSSLKFLWYGGSPMPLELLKRGLQSFGPIIAQGYGQSESGPAISCLSRQDHNVLDKPEAEQKKLISTGRPDVGVHVRIVDEAGQDLPQGEVGEIIVRSGHVMLEYWQRPEDTEAAVRDGWLHTGDMGYYDEQGYIYIADRKKDMIISGGENVYPREIEDVLYRHPAVLEAAVIGLPDDYWVEKVHAVIVVKPEADCCADDVILFCKQYLAGYKTPKSVDFLETLPKNATGKILKTELRNMYK